MKYARRFPTVTEFNLAYNGQEYSKPWISYTDENGELAYNKPKSLREKMREIPLTIEVPENTTFYILEDSTDYTASTNLQDIQYKVNNGNWQTGITYNGISLNSGDKIQLKAERQNGYDWRLGVMTGTTNSYQITEGVQVYGNPLSLIDPDDFESIDVYPTSTAAGFIGYFNSIFTNIGLYDASAIYLPETLSNHCYRNMFSKCSFLEIPPELPATTLAQYCYAGMFQLCTSLEKAPVLPAITLNNFSYISMFFGCSNLNYVKCMAQDISATNSHLYWLSGVSATGNFLKPSNMSDWPSGESGIPSGWTARNLDWEE